MVERTRTTATEDAKLSPGRGEGSAGNSRRHALAAMLGALPWAQATLEARDSSARLRLALSENMFGDVNLNDARAAMMIWIKAMTKDLNLDLDTAMFCSTQEIHDRVRRGELDAISVNILEYRPIAGLLDSSQIVAAGGLAGVEQYVILARQKGAIRQLADLKGRQLRTLKSPKMCLASDWLLTLLEDGHHGTAEQFFGSMATDYKFSRVVLPVFFGQADACLTSLRGFETMCELNPQVARDLKVIASSPVMVVSFFIFRRNFYSTNRDRAIKALMSLRTSISGRQLATLFQFDELAVLDARCLMPALSIISAADRARGRQGGGSRKG